MLTKTPYHSYRCGSLSRGCALCVQGRKLVLFITGVCSCSCYFCPLSDTKKNKDGMWANERKIGSMSEAIEEARISKARGAGITGGDPFLRLERTLNAIRQLKRRFTNFHIHLYAPLNHVTLKKIRMLEKAGLDEIRFHPIIGDSKHVGKLKLLDQIKITKGIEVPVIPGTERELRNIIDLAAGRVDFINLNELEISDTNANKLVERGFVPKNRTSYAVLGSEELAKKMLVYCARKGVSCHYCTATLKDRVQLGNRIRLRAKSVALKTDRIDSDGLLVRGSLYLPQLVPGAGYSRKILATDRGKCLKLLQQKKSAAAMLGMRTVIDAQKLRLVCEAGAVRKNIKVIKSLGLVGAIVKQYPTFDQTLIEVEIVQ